MGGTHPPGRAACGGKSRVDPRSSWRTFDAGGEKSRAPRGLPCLPSHRKFNHFSDCDLLSDRLRSL